MAEKIIDDSLRSGKTYNIRLELNIRRIDHSIFTSVKVVPVGGGIPKNILADSVVRSLLSAHVEAIENSLSKNGQIEMLEFSIKSLRKNIDEIKASRLPPVSLN